MAQNAIPRNGLSSVAPPSRRPASTTDGSEAAAPARRDQRDRQQPERARQPVLRRVEHRAVHAVDPEPVVPPGRHGVDVDVSERRRATGRAARGHGRPQTPRRSMRARRARRRAPPRFGAGPRSRRSSRPMRAAGPRWQSQLTLSATWTSRTGPGRPRSARRARGSRSSSSAARGPPCTDFAAASRTGSSPRSAPCATRNRP